MKLWDNAPGLLTEEPGITFYPAENKKTDACTVIFPGGGYCCRAPHEGAGYAEFLNKYGMNAFVVDYRVSPARFPVELLDARRAVRFVRYNAEKFGIDKNKVAVMGSSAGGHLAALLSTYTDPIDYENLDETDSQPYLPDATILCYPVISDPSYGTETHVGSYESLLGAENLDKAKLYAPALLVNESTPPAFLWHTFADEGVNVKNSFNYASALRDFGIPCELHVFPEGRHGLGTAECIPHTAQWTGLLIEWFRDKGWL